MNLVLFYCFMVSMCAFMQYAFHSWLINTCSVYRPVVVVESLVTFTKTFNSFVVERLHIERAMQEHTPPSNVPTTCIAPILGAVNTHKGPCKSVFVGNYCANPYIQVLHCTVHVYFQWLHTWLVQVRIFRIYEASQIRQSTHPFMQRLCSWIRKQSWV